MEKANHFRELEVWKLGRQIRQEIYRLTQTFPTAERTNLVIQMRRAAVSITANLAEGYGKYSYKENRNYCRTSRASAYELQDHLTASLDEGLVSKATFVDLDRKLLQFIKRTNSYIRAIGPLRTIDQ